MSLLQKYIATLKLPGYSGAVLNQGMACCQLPHAYQIMQIHTAYAHLITHHKQHHSYASDMLSMPSSALHGCVSVVLPASNG